MCTLLGLSFFCKGFNRFGTVFTTRLLTKCIFGVKNGLNANGFT